MCALSPVKREMILPAIVAITLIGIVVFGPLLAPFDPYKPFPLDVLKPPSADHWFGTNSYGADVFSRVLYAAQLDILLAVSGVLGGLIVSLPLGAALGYYRGPLVTVALRALDFVQSFPPFILAIAIASFSGPDLITVIFILVVLNIPIFTRLLRTEVQSLRGRAFVEAARCIGNSDANVIIRHILPNALGAVIAQTSVNIGWALIITAGLSFVGAGLVPPTPEWGAMISEGAPYILTGEWWVVAFPGASLCLTVLFFSVLGDFFAGRITK